MRLCRLITLIILSCWACVAFSQTTTPFIVIDQFGYLPSAKKIAVVRVPKRGFDSTQIFTPGTSYAVMNATTNTAVYTAAISAWNNGAVDTTSGDKCWWFDFSSVTTPGSYYIKDLTNNTKSYSFAINNAVYKDVLKAAMRMLFYQRRGCVKRAAFAGAGWADSINFAGALQDTHCRLYNALTNASTEHDLSGGWFDAGDLNKYTPWTCDYVVALLNAYRENVNAWGDDYNIPESGNGIPDILDETKWGMDFLLRTQQLNGSALSVVGGGGASPPSSYTGQSYYGPATTNATLSCAGAFALGAIIYRQLNTTAYNTYADTLQARAIKAWNWGLANPSVLFDNTGLVAAGNQETDSTGRFFKKMRAAVYLYELTGNATYKTAFENDYKSFPLIAWSNFVGQYWTDQQDLVMHYSSLPNITPTVATTIKNALASGFNAAGDYISAIPNDPYMAFIKDYNWGSNQYKAGYGIQFYDIVNNNVITTNTTPLLNAAEDYVHYIHGVNPFGYVYLTNMNGIGASNSISTIFHTWFADGSSLWDQAGVSKYGPPPGYLSGGPNNSYSWDGCCPSGCGSTGNNSLCYATTLVPPNHQPRQKSYKDFNNGWPLDSWSLTEPDCGYQVAYIRLLSKYLDLTKMTQTITLAKGWNLISFNISPTYKQIDSVFKPIIANITEIKTFDGFWEKGQNTALNSLTAITDGGAYLVYLTAPSTLTVVGKTVRLPLTTNLKSGWNLVGIPSQTADSIATEVGTKPISLVKDFDAYWQASGTPSITTFDVGKGYFVKATASTTLNW